MASRQNFYNTIEEFSKINTSKKSVIFALLHIRGLLRRSVLLILLEWEEKKLFSAPIQEAFNLLNAPSWGTWYHLLTRIIRSGKDIQTEPTKREGVDGKIGAIDTILKTVTHLIPARHQTSMSLFVEHVGLKENLISILVLFKAVISLRNEIKYKRVQEEQWYDETLKLILPVCKILSIMSNELDQFPHSEPWFLNESLSFDGFDGDGFAHYISEGVENAVASKEQTAKVRTVLLKLTGGHTFNVLNEKNRDNLYFNQLLMGKPFYHQGAAHIHDGYNLLSGQDVCIKIFKQETDPQFTGKYVQGADFWKKVPYQAAAIIFQKGSIQWETYFQNQKLPRWASEYFTKEGTPKQKESFYIAVEKIHGYSLYQIELLLTLRPDVSITTLLKSHTVLYPILRQAVLNSNILAREQFMALLIEELSKLPHSGKRAVNKSLLELFRSAAESMLHIHRHDVVHRAVHTNNVIVTPYGRVVYLDPGAIKTENELGRVALSPAKVKEIRLYMAPEQHVIESKNSYFGKPIDIYSLCVIFLELFSRKRFMEYNGDNIDVIVAKKIKGDSASNFHQKFVGLAPEVKRVLRQGLSLDPSRRPTVEQLYEDLRLLSEKRPPRWLKIPLYRKINYLYANNRVLFNLIFISLLLGSSVGYYFYEQKNRELRESKVALLSAKAQINDLRGETANVIERMKKEVEEAKEKEKGDSSQIQGNWVSRESYLSVIKENEQLRKKLGTAAKSVPTQKAIQQHNPIIVTRVDPRVSDFLQSAISRFHSEQLYHDVLINSKDALSYNLGPNFSILANYAMGNSPTLQTLLPSLGENTFIGKLSGANLLLSGGNQVEILSSKDGKIIKAFLTESGVESLVVSEDGSVFALGLKNENIVIYSGPNFETKQKVESFSGPVTSLAISPDKSILVSGHGSGKLKLWRMNTLSSFSTFTASKGAVTALSFISGQEHFVAGSEKGSLSIYNIPNNKVVSELVPHASAVKSIAFQPSSGLLASCSVDKSIALYHYPTLKKVTALSSKNSISVVLFIDESLVAIGSSYEVFELGSYKKKISIPICETPAVSAIALNANKVIISSKEGVQFWSQPIGELEWKGHSGGVEMTRGLAIGNSIVSCGLDKTVKVWNSKTGRNINSLITKEREVVALSASQRNNRVAGASDKSLLFWDLENSNQPQEFLTSSAARFVSVALSDRAEHLAGVLDDGSVVAYDVNTKNVLFQTDGGRDESPLADVDFLPEGTGLITLRENGTIEKRNLQGGVIHSMESGLKDTLFLSISLNGGYVSTCSKNETIVFRLTDGKQIFRETSSAGNLVMTSLSSDGSILAAATAGGILSLYSLPHEKLILSQKIEFPITAIRFSFDDSSIFISGKGGQISVWSTGLGNSQLLSRITTFLDSAMNRKLDPAGNIAFLSGKDFLNKKLQLASQGKLFYEEEGGVANLPLLKESLRKFK